MAKYEQAYDGDIIAPRMDKYKLACCDCGLVHDIKFWVEDEQVFFQIARNNRSTGQKRRHMKDLFSPVVRAMIE